MSTSEKDITTTEWTKITDPGQSGTCWKKTGAVIVIDHTVDGAGAATLPLASPLVTVGKSKRAPLDQDNTDVLGLPADSALDVFYALALDKVGKLAVDVI